MTATRVQARKQRIFCSVFPIDVSQPTPTLPSSGRGEAFGGHHGASISNQHLTAREARRSSSLPVKEASHQLRSGRKLNSSNAVSDQVRWDRAWHTVTTRILIPSSVSLEDSFGTLAPLSQDADAEFYEALRVVTNPDQVVPEALHTESLLEWHSSQVRLHFVNHVIPLLGACASQENSQHVLNSSIRTLEAAHRQYLWGLSLIARGLDQRQDGASAAAMERFQQDLNAMVGSSWLEGLTDALRDVLHQLVGMILQSGNGSLDHSVESHDATFIATEHLFELVESLRKVGLAGEKLQVIFAETMDLCMRDYIRTTYHKAWQKPQSGTDATSNYRTGCLDHLKTWIENQYARLVVQVFDKIGGQVEYADMERWQSIATERLALLRMHELFDIVLHWPHSKEGLTDLCSAVATPESRLRLTDTFSSILQKRLLHPGKSTLNILQTYISMIRTFHALDHSKVLLDRVVPALQLYLCQREDAIRIVVMGLLANPLDQGAKDGTTLVELAKILGETSQQSRRYADDDDLDWDDMNWVPDPVDAGINYKRPKNEDVIGTLIHALGAQDTFIREFQSIIAERLLSSQATFSQEIKVLTLLKRRFGESSMQNCEVMMKDVQDSKRVDATLRKGMQALTQRGDIPAPAYRSKILSRLFWPSLPGESFVVPPPVAQVRKHYESGFEQLKSSRKLTWLDALGSAHVRLELEDRTIAMDCRAYEAAVIYAFQTDDTIMQTASSATPCKRTFDELWQHLMMDEDMLDAALRFWVSCRVLRDMGNRTYLVLERLDDEAVAAESEDATSSGSATLGSGAAGASTSPKKTKGLDAKEEERRTVYWQFIVGMLTNSGPAMPLGQIAMMMKMLIADGCPWSNEELQEFLGDKLNAGQLEFSGGKYRLPKK